MRRNRLEAIKVSEAFKPKDAVQAVRHGGGGIILWYWRIAQSGWTNGDLSPHS